MKTGRSADALNWIELKKVVRIPSSNWRPTVCYINLRHGFANVQCYAESRNVNELRLQTQIPKSYMRYVSIWSLERHGRIVQDWIAVEPGKASSIKSTTLKSPWTIVPLGANFRKMPSKLSWKSSELLRPLSDGGGMKFRVYPYVLQPMDSAPRAAELLWCNWIIHKEKRRKSASRQRWREK